MKIIKVTMPVAYNLEIDDDTNNEEHSNPDEMYDNFIKIFDTIFSPKNKNVKKKKLKTKTIYEFKKYECNLIVHVAKNKVYYSVKLNTVNYDTKTENIIYFDETMPYYEDSLYWRILKDFSILFLRCKNLQYAPEYHVDILPSICLTADNIPWHSEKEEEILKPMVYCKIIGK